MTEEEEKLCGPWRIHNFITDDGTSQTVENLGSAPLEPRRSMRNRNAPLRFSDFGLFLLVLMGLQKI